MRQTPTQAVREPCQFCGADHDEMECFRVHIDEEEMFDACYDIATMMKEETGDFPEPSELAQEYFDKNLDREEVDSVIDIARNAVQDAERDWRR